MAKNDKVEKKLIDGLANEIPVEEKNTKDLEESKESVKEKELSKDEIENQKVRQEIDNMDLDDNLKIHMQSQAQEIQSLEENEKVKSLLKIAKEKGVIFSVNVAKKMNDPYILDTFHDVLAKEGYYKEFLK